LLFARFCFWQFGEPSLQVVAPQFIEWPRWRRASVETSFFETKLEILGIGAHFVAFGVFTALRLAVRNVKELTHSVIANTDRPLRTRR
jgi:hypothetical protein